MLYDLFNKRYNNIFFNDGGGSGEGDDKTPKQAMFTQEQVNTLMKEHKQSLRQEIETLRSQLTNDPEKTALKEQLSSLETRLNPLIEKLSKDSDDDDNKKPKNVEEAIVALESKFEKLSNESSRLKELEDKLARETAARQQAEQARISSERDNMLTRALTKVNCLDIPRGIKLLHDYMEYNNETGKWSMIDEEKNEYSVTEGVNKLLPDYMKKPLTGDKTGAGSQTSKSIINQMETELVDAKNELEEAKKQAIANPRDSQALARVQRATRELREKERKLNTAKAV